MAKFIKEEAYLKGRLVIGRGVAAISWDKVLLKANVYGYWIKLDENKKDQEEGISIPTTNEYAAELIGVRI